MDKRKGTRITYRTAGSNPSGDNRETLKHVPSATEAQFLESMRDPGAAFFHITERETYAMCKLWYGDIPFVMLEPNPVTFYYSLAFDSFPQLADARQRLDQQFGALSSLVEASGQLAVAYSYLFKVTTVCLTFSFLALEAFVNQQLPRHGNITYKGKQVTRERIERYLPFDEKLDAILPLLSGKNFTKAHPRHRSAIAKLKSLRHQIAHLKQTPGSGITTYESFFQEILNVKLKQILAAVKACINYYYPKLIVNYSYTPMPPKPRR